MKLAKLTSGAGMMLTMVLALASTLPAQAQTLTVLHTFTNLPDGRGRLGGCCSTRLATSMARPPSAEQSDTDLCSRLTPAATYPFSTASLARRTGTSLSAG